MKLADVHLGQTRGVFFRKQLVLATQTADRVVWYADNDVYTTQVIRTWPFDPFFQVLQVERKDNAPCMPLCVTLGLNDSPLVAVPSIALAGSPMLDKNGLVGMVYAEGKGYMFSAKELLQLLQWHMRPDFQRS